MDTIKKIQQAIEDKKKNEMNRPHDTKKEWAKFLFTNENMAPQQIAATTGIAEKKITAWIANENWQNVRKKMHASRQHQIELMYDILEVLSIQGKNALEDSDPKTNPDTTAIMRITSSIKKLEKESGLGDMIFTLKELITFVIKENFEQGQLISHWADLFVKDRISKLKL